MTPCRADNRIPSAGSFPPKTEQLPAQSAIQAKARPGLRAGAGGVGGLVAVSVDGSFYFPGYDNNGNVIGYWNETGSLVAEYAYDAFGNTIASSGSMSAVFPHRFSTKYYDAETDLYYYGYRYYSPSLGRWISRDPIEEEDFSNLFLFCKNSPTSFSDLLGTRMLGTWPASTNREGWAFLGTMNFPGAGYSGEFRTRPTSFFDLAAKIHDLHYMINGLNFTGEGLIPWRHRSFLPWNWDKHNKDPRISRLAKADFIFKKMNEAKWDAGWWSGTLNYLSRRVFFDDPKHFCKGDDFTNFLKAEQSFELNDPSKFLMIPYSRLSVPPVLEETYTYRKYHPPRNPRGVGVGRWTTETETRIVPDYLASAPEDSSPGFFSWAEQTYGTTWTRIQFITEDTDYTFQW